MEAAGNTGSNLLAVQQCVPCVVVRDARESTYAEPVKHVEEKGSCFVQTATGIKRALSVTELVILRRQPRSTSATTVAEAGHVQNVRVLAVARIVMGQACVANVKDRIW